MLSDTLPFFVRRFSKPDETGGILFFEGMSKIVVGPMARLLKIPKTLRYVDEIVRNGMACQRLLEILFGVALGKSLTDFHHGLMAEGTSHVIAQGLSFVFSAHHEVCRRGDEKRKQGIIRG